VPFSPGYRRGFRPDRKGSPRRGRATSGSIALIPRGRSSRRRGRSSATFTDTSRVESMAAKATAPRPSRLEAKDRRTGQILQETPVERTTLHDIFIKIFSFSCYVYAAPVENLGIIFRRMLRRIYQTREERAIFSVPTQLLRYLRG
jgi:hypothetical protein